MLVTSIGIFSLRIVWHTQKYKIWTHGKFWSETEPQTWALSDLLDLYQDLMDLPHFHSTACTFFSSSNMEWTKVLLAGQWASTTLFQPAC